MTASAARRGKDKGHDKDQGHADEAPGQGPQGPQGPPQQTPLGARAEPDGEGVWLALEGEAFSAGGHLEAPAAERLIRQLARALPDDEAADDGDGGEPDSGEGEPEDGSDTNPGAPEVSTPL